MSSNEQGFQSRNYRGISKKDAQAKPAGAADAAGQAEGAAGRLVPIDPDAVPFANVQVDVPTLSAVPAQRVADDGAEDAADAAPKPEPDADAAAGAETGADGAGAPGVSAAPVESGADAAANAAPEADAEPEADAAPEPEADDVAAPETATEPEPEASAVPDAPAAPEAQEVPDPFAPATQPGESSSPDLTVVHEPVRLEEDAAAPASGDAAAAQAGAGTPAADGGAAASAPSGPGDAASSYARGNASYKHRRGSNFSSGQRIALVVVAVVAVVLCAIGGFAIATWQDAQDSIKLEDETIKEDLKPVEYTKPYWTLILGSDKRPSEDGEDGSRSDVIMLARIDENDKLVTLVSIPRDTKVELGGYGTQKINSAYELGGAKLAIKTVEEYAAVDISHYVEVYFKGFSKLVDEIGGVDVVVPEYVSYKGVELEPGKHHLNGKEALTFARNRKTYTSFKGMGDFRRTECQRILVAAIAKKVLSQSPTELPGTIKALTKCFSTDMALEDIVALATKMQGMDEDSFYSVMCPSTAGYVDGVSYTFTYVNQWKLIMQRAKAGERPNLDKQEKKICGKKDEDSTWYQDLDMSKKIPKDVRKKLKEYWKQQEEKAAVKDVATQEATAAQGEGGGAAVQPANG